MQFRNNSNKPIVLRSDGRYIIPAGGTVDIDVMNQQALFLSPVEASYIHRNKKGHLVEGVFSVTSKMIIEEARPDAAITLECNRYEKVFSDEAYLAVTAAAKLCRVTLLSMSVEDKDTVINEAITAKDASNKNSKKWHHIFDVFEAIVHAFYGIPIYIIMYFCLRNYFSLKVTLISILIAYILIFMLCMIVGKTTDIFIKKISRTKNSTTESTVNQYFNEQHIRNFIFSDDVLKTKQ